MVQQAHLSESTSFDQLCDHGIVSHSNVKLLTALHCCGHPSSHYNVGNEDDSFDESLEWAIKLYQLNFHLNITGELNFATTKQMMKPKCRCPMLSTEQVQCGPAARDAIWAPTISLLSLTLASSLMLQNGVLLRPISPMGYSKVFRSSTSKSLDPFTRAQL